MCNTYVYVYIDTLLPVASTTVIDKIGLVSRSDPVPPFGGLTSLMRIHVAQELITFLYLLIVSGISRLTHKDS